MRINWIKEIEKYFGGTPFTGEQLKEATKTWGEKAQKALRFHVKTGKVKRYRNGSYSLVGFRKEKETVTGFVKDLSRKHGDDPFTVDQALEIAGCKRTTLHARLHTMKNKGLLKKEGKGVYRLTDGAHNSVAQEFREEYKAEPKRHGESNGFLKKLSEVLGDDVMREWVYRTAMSSSECIKVLENAAVNSIAEAIKQK